MKNRLKLIKKMLVQGLSSSEKILLSEEEPVKHLLNRQWEEKSDRHLLDKVDPELIWENITVACLGSKKKSQSVKKIRFFRFAYATAAVVVLLLIGTWMAHLMTDSYIIVKAPADQRIACMLPDSSTIWLNAGGTIRYKEAFCKDRKVFLEGEGFFEVKKMSSSPFRVLFHGACVEVKGTVFSIKVENRKSEVVLLSGKVAFSVPEANVQVEMKPSDRIIYDSSSQQVDVTQVDAVEYDWRSTEYHFVDKPLGELIDFLNRTYHVTIAMKNEGYAKSKFSGTIRKDESLTDVLNKVCFAFDLHLKQTDQSIVLE